MATANANEARRNFRLIIGDKMEHDDYQRQTAGSYQTDPIREQLCRFRNGEGGKRFTVEDWLRW